MWLFEYCYVSVLVLLSFWTKHFVCLRLSASSYMSTESVCKMEQLSVFKWQNKCPVFPKFVQKPVTSTQIVLGLRHLTGLGSIGLFCFSVSFFVVGFLFEFSFPLIPSWLPSASGEDEHAHRWWQHGPLHLHAHGSNPHCTGDQTGLRSVIQPLPSLRAKSVQVHF